MCHSLCHCCSLECHVSQPVSLLQPHAVPDAYRRRCGSTSSSDKTRLTAPSTGDNQKTKARREKSGVRKEGVAGKGGMSRREKEREGSGCESEEEEDLPLSRVKELKVGC